LGIAREEGETLLAAQFTGDVLELNIKTLAQ